MNIQGYNFKGPWILGTKFLSVSGVYVVFTNQKWLDIGETVDLGQRINNNSHERQSQWIICSDRLPVYIGFLQENDYRQRLNVESYLRQTLLPLCGKK